MENAIKRILRNHGHQIVIRDGISYVEEHIYDADGKCETVTHDITGWDVDDTREFLGY